MLGLVAAVGLLVAVDVRVHSTKTYVSTVGVLVLPTGVESARWSGGRTGGEINLDSEAQLLKSVDVAARAKALLKVAEEPRDLAAKVAVAVPPNTSVLNISYRAPTPEDAQRSAQTFAKAYLDNRAGVAIATLKTRSAALLAQIAAARKSMQEVAARRAALPESSPERAVAEAQERVLINRISQLSAELSPIQAALTGQVEPGRVITSPKLPGGD